MTAPAFDRPLVLRGTPKHYHWGRSRQDSIICTLHPELEGERPLAEYWLGAHPSGSAFIKGGLPGERGRELSLADLIREQPEAMLGPVNLRTFGPTLPFMFKILSIAEPLSIQSHPDLTLAGELHRADPLNYPDPWHKPEAGVAISPTKMVCGIRTSKNDIAKILHLSREEILARVVALKSDPALSHIPESHRDLARALFRKFPDDDAGILCSFELEILDLAPGDAIFIPPGVIHAYLEGELMECMASSDNVVRVGLTPKFRDVPTLTRMLATQPEKGTQPLIVRKGTPGLSDFPVREFSLEFFDGAGRTTRKSVDSPELIFSLDAEGVCHSAGGAIPIIAGTCLFIPAALQNYELHFERGRAARVHVPA